MRGKTIHSNGILDELSRQYYIDDDKPKCDIENINIFNIFKDKFVTNKRTFESKEVVSAVFEQMASLGLLKDKSLDQDTINKISDGLSKTFAEIEAIQSFRLHLSGVIDEPVESFENSNLNYADFVREHFPKNIRKGYLPIDEIQDEKLRRRLIVENCRGSLPSDLKNICASKQDRIQGKREAFSRIAGIQNEEQDQIQKIAQSLYTRDAKKPKNFASDIKIK